MPGARARTPTATVEDHIPLAIVLLVCGFGVASLSGAMLKWLGPDLHPVQIAWARYGFYLISLLPFGLWRYGAGLLKPAQPVIQIVRAIMILGATLLFIVVVNKMPLANAIAIIYIYPFIITALSGVFLGERVPLFAWLGVVAGFAGIVIVMRPDPANMNMAALQALACGCMYAVHLLFTRRVAKDGSPLVATFYMALAIIAILTPFLPTVWQPMLGWQIAGLAVMGALNAAAHCTIMMAFQRAPASTLAPFAYVEIVFMVGYGAMLFGDIPDALTMIGICVIIASGLVVSQAPRVARAIARRRGVAG